MKIIEKQDVIVECLEREIERLTVDALDCYRAMNYFTLEEKYRLCLKVKLKCRSKYKRELKRYKRLCQMERQMIAIKKLIAFDWSKGESQCSTMIK